MENLERFAPMNEINLKKALLFCKIGNFFTGKTDNFSVDRDGTIKEYCGGVRTSIDRITHRV